jgi:hypothetical protein
MRSTAWVNSKSELEFMPAESSIDNPAIPVAAASATFFATSSGAVAKPPSKSAFTGSSTVDARVLKWASASSSVA